MKPIGECKPGSCDYWLVSEAARRLGSQACTLGARHIKDGTLRLQFGREVSYYAKSIVDAVAQGEKSPEQALKDLKSEQSSLLSQSTEIAQKGVGVIAGAFQFAAGAGICYGSAGTLCLLAGAPMMAHGANNIYENGKNLWEGRKDTEGPVRKGYQEVSKMMGGGELEGNMAYGAVDLGLSVYGIRRMVLKPDAWRLFKYVKTDNIRSYKIAGKNTLILEGVSDSLTGRSMYREYKEEQETKEKPMNSLYVSASYFTLSLITFLVFYFLSRHFSGKKFSWKWFYMFLISAFFFGSFHLSTVKYGYDILFPALKPILKGNQVVGWIALVSIFLHICCIPTQNEPIRWFSRK